MCGHEYCRLSSHGVPYLVVSLTRAESFVASKLHGRLSIAGLLIFFSELKLQLPVAARKPRATAPGSLCMCAPM